MQSLASELGPLGIRANAMAVGVIDGATARAPMPALAAADGGGCSPRG